MQILLSFWFTGTNTWWPVLDQEVTDRMGLKLIFPSPLKNAHSEKAETTWEQHHVISILWLILYLLCRQQFPGLQEQLGGGGGDSYFQCYIPTNSEKNFKKLVMNKDFSMWLPSLHWKRRRRITFGGLHKAFYYLLSTVYTNQTVKL